MLFPELPSNDGPGHPRKRKQAEWEDPHKKGHKDYVIKSKSTHE